MTLNKYAGQWNREEEFYRGFILYTDTDPHEPSRTCWEYFVTVRQFPYGQRIILSSLGFYSRMRALKEGKKAIDQYLVKILVARVAF